MIQKLRHRRLYAFYESKVLNTLMLVIIVSLLSAVYFKTLLLPVICSMIAFLFFIGYSCWLWFWKPCRIKINNRLSDISGLYTLYFIIIASFDLANLLWYLIPIAFSVIVLFVLMVWPSDEEFTITRQ